MALGVFVVALPGSAQMPVARLLTVFPPGGAAGATVEVTVSGADLEQAAQLRFTSSGIQAELKPGDNAEAGGAHTFLVHLATNTPPGRFDVRVAGRFGVSNPRVFAVGEHPETNVGDGHTTADTALPLATDTTANGRVQAGAADYFKLTLPAGRRVVVVCAAGELDSRLAPVLVLSRAGGGEVARSRRHGVLDFTAPAAGDYVLQLHDQSFRGGSEYFYRLTAGTGPYVEWVDPPAGQAGARGKFRIFGRNLPGGTPAREGLGDGPAREQLEVEIELPKSVEGVGGAETPGRATEAGLQYFNYRFRGTNGWANPVRLAVTPQPVLAAPPGGAVSTNLSLTVPGDWAGWFGPKGGWSSADFTAKKGDIYRVEVFSHRLGYATSPLLVVQRVGTNDQGGERVSELREFGGSDANAGGVDAATLNYDPTGKLEISENGRYRLKVRDLFHRVAPDYRAAFRVSLRPETPDFSLLAIPVAPPPANKDTKEALIWNPFLRRGETQPVRVVALRQDGWDGDIDLTVGGLPPGVTAGPARIAAGKTAALLCLTAAENAAAWFGAIQIIGKAKAGGRELAHPARGTAVQWTVGDYNNEAVGSRLTTEFDIAVSGVETAPVIVTPAEAKPVEGPAETKLKIPLRIARPGDFTGTLKLKATGLAALDSLKELEVEAKTTNATLEIDPAAAKLGPGDYTFHLEAQTAGKYRRLAEVAKAADANQTEAESRAKDAAKAVQTATDAKAAAARALAEAEPRAKTAAGELAAAEKAATMAATAQLAALRDLTLANAELAPMPDHPAHLAAQKAAAQAAEAAAEPARKAAAALAQARSREHEAAEQLAAARVNGPKTEAAEQQAKTALKTAEDQRESAKNRAKEAAKTAEPRDLTITVYSAPITFRVTAPVQKVAAK